MHNNPSVLIGYSRVSTEGQRDGYGIKIQEDRIKLYAEAKGVPLVRIFRDDGVSGALAVRPALVELMNYAEANRQMNLGLVFLRLDRLARDLLIQEGLIADFHKHGLQVFSIEEEDLCSTDPTRKLFRQMKGMLAEYEKAMITARMSAGRIRKAQEGRYPGGRVSYGFRIEKDLYVPVEEELTIVREIRRLRRRNSNGRRLSYGKIAEVLSQREVMPPSGRKWYPMTVRLLATSDFYKGTFRYGSVVTHRPELKIV